jgi:hypothetical protein
MLTAVRAVGASMLSHFCSERSLQSFATSIAPRPSCTAPSLARWVNDFAYHLANDSRFRAYRHASVSWTHQNLFGATIVCLDQFSEGWHKSSKHCRWPRHSQGRSPFLPAWRRCWPPHCSTSPWLPLLGPPLPPLTPRAPMAVTALAGAPALRQRRRHSFAGVRPRCWRLSGGLGRAALPRCSWLWGAQGKANQHSRLWCAVVLCWFHLWDCDTSGKP